MDVALSPQEEIARRLVDWRAGRPRGPYTLELYPTLRCNLDCAFCDTTYRKKRAADELTRERYLDLADEAAALEVRRCYILGGGEPMVAREITPDLMARLKSHGIYGILGTNATLFTEEHLARLVEIGWDEIHVSLDGATAATHDQLRGQRGTFARATSVLRRLGDLKRAHQRSNPQLLIHTVVTRVNAGEVAELVDLAHELGCFRVNFDALVAYRPEQEALKLGPEDRSRLARAAEEGLRRAARYGIATTLEQFITTGARALDRGNMAFDLGGPRELFAAPCLNPWHHIVIHHNGRVSPCCVIPAEDHADDAHTRSLAELWFHGSYFTRMRAAFVDKALTRHCPNCSMAIISQNDTVRGHLPKEG